MGHCKVAIQMDERATAILEMEQNDYRFTLQRFLSGKYFNQQRLGSKRAQGVNSFSNRVDSTSRILHRFSKEIFRAVVSSCTMPLVTHLLIYPRAAAKEAKKLLKKRKTSLVLYNAFGLVDSQLNGMESADKIFATAITMSKSLPQDQQDDTIVLWRSWIWENLRRGRSGHANKLLLHLTEDNIPNPMDGRQTNMTFPPAVVLRIRQFLDNGIYRCLLKGLYYQAALYVELMAIFTYSLHKWSISAALISFQETAKQYNKNEDHLYFLELLHQARANLITYHVGQSKPYKPMEIKTVLSESIKLFPHNTMFLVIYANFELSFSLNDRLRSFLSHPEFFETNDALVNSLVAIWSEVRRLPELGGSTHGIRAMFEKRVESKA
jgi:hypothetical protein